jgi:hypothetical protein
MADLLQNTLAGRYKVERRVGGGGQADVYKATDLASNREVAIKVLSLKPGDDRYTRHKALFDREAQVRVDDPRVMSAIATFSEAGHDFLVMPFVDGISLEGFAFSRAESLSISEACRLGAELFERLEAVHAAGWVHRDVKAGNVLVDDAGALYLIDFGIAKRAGSNNGSGPREGFLGSVQVCSPEQLLDGRLADFRSDRYSAGCLVYLLLTGTYPTRLGEPASVAQRLLHETPTRPVRFRPDVPQDIDDIVMALLAKSPESRPSSDREVIDCLRGQTAPRAASSQVNCHHCGERLASSKSVYCCYCGGRLEAGYSPSRCLSCRTPIGDGIAACIVCGAPFPETIARLRFSSGPLAGEVFRIPAGDTDVGRQQLLPGDRSLSRQHIRFTWNENGLVAHNLKASNPSLINGVALTSPRPLMVGDTIVLGMSQGIFEI